MEKGKKREINCKAITENVKTQGEYKGEKIDLYTQETFRLNGHVGCD